MKLFLVLVAFAILAGMYLWRKQVSVASQENKGFDLTYPSAPGRKTRTEDEPRKKSPQKVFKKSYLNYRLVLVSSKRLKRSLHIAIWIRYGDYP
ncbi:MAG: hypothetical protein J6I85_04100 [Clostridia bacterium]|nr:hypothetical protein [Clostridia bacterium]